MANRIRGRNRLNPPQASPTGVAFPSPVGKILNVVPEKFKWIATLVLPLIIGGGSGFMLTPSNKEPLAHAQAAATQGQDQASKSSAELAAKAAEVAHLTTDNIGLRANLSGQAKALDTQLEAAHRANATLEQANAKLDQNVKDLTQNVKSLQQNLATTKNTADALRPFASRGFVEWKGYGGQVTFTPCQPRQHHRRRLPRPRLRDRGRGRLRSRSARVAAGQREGSGELRDADQRAAERQ